VTDAKLRADLPEGMARTCTISVQSPSNLTLFFGAYRISRETRPTRNKETFQLHVAECASQH